ncbi:MAG: FecR domain-containing protein [Hyphomonadaceae bacterium]|nr:FecR domain-containing protein [Hyphomonadaceae bacterium]
MSERADASDAEQEASRWIARLESADVTLEDHKRFRQWLAATPGNKAAYEAVSGTWDRLDALRHLVPASSPPKPSRRILLLGSAGVVAAGVAGALIIPRFIPDRGVIYETGVGERTTIALEDGSTSELNAAARIRVAYSPNERLVYLDDGEAFFDVQPNPERPFVVQTPYGSVRVRGTSFVVRIGPSGARATVIHGVVEGFIVGAAPSSSVTAEANQEIAFDAQGLVGKSVPSPVVERRLAWRQGMLAFDGETLREATVEIERQTGARFVFADASLEDLRIGGYVSATDQQAFLDLLEANLGIHAARDSSGALVLTRPTR